MSNVNQINESTQPIGVQGANKPKGAQASDAFDALLNSAIDKTDKTEEDTMVSGLGEIAAPGFDLKSPSSVVTGKTDELLGLMDTYAAQLGNPDISLKRIAPVLEQMNSDAQRLMEETRFLGSQETGLKEIATQTAIAARTEYEKFQRGDYLS